MRRGSGLELFLWSCLMATLASAAMAESLAPMAAPTANRPVAPNAALRFEPGELRLGEAPIGTSSERRSVRLRNLGDAASVLSGWSVVGDVVVDTDCPHVLQRNESCVVEIGFRPTAPGGRRAALQVYDETRAAVVNLDISGVGLDPDAKWLVTAKMNVPGKQASKQKGD